MRVLERIVPEGGFLLGSSYHYAQERTGALRADTLNVRIKDFVTWIDHEPILAPTHHPRSRR
ncbi:hypothetical protein [Kitasatospora sp. NPDC015120]|uniref:hypothetical protein n=1 Tax=Kitasatospora sp. NPDC015120 TaxID=3364023 RepID=UPI0036F4ACF0